jgi:hypothetical protein
MNKVLAILATIGLLGGAYGGISAAAEPELTGSASGLVICHTHRTTSPSGPDRYVWVNYPARCAIDGSEIAITYGFPRWWSNARVRAWCDHFGGDFSPVSHHGRNCYDHDK